MSVCPLKHFVLCRIGQGSGSIVKTSAFLPPMLLTCNHVIPSKDVARDCLIYFDCDNHKNPGVEVLGKDLFDLDEEDSFVTHEVSYVCELYVYVCVLCVCMYIRVCVCVCVCACV